MTRNGICEKLLLFSFVFLFAASSAKGLEWPLAQAEVLSLFGQKTETGVERGIIIEGESTVRAAGDSIVLVAITKNRNMTGFPSALGNAVLLAHSDGIVSVYGNLENTEMLAGRSQVETNAVIARTGKSAWEGAANERQEGRGSCIFQIADQKQNVLLNPLLLLPPKEDSLRPVIRSVSLESDSGQTYNLASSRHIAGGSYKVYAAVTDSYNGNRNSPQLAPFRVSVIVNGMEASAVSFDTMIRKQNTLVPNSFPEYLDGNIPLYNEDGDIYAGNISLRRGRAEITIIARDFAGNERASDFMLQVE